MGVLIVDNYEQGCRIAFERIKQVVTQRERPVLGLATGSSPIGIYNLMVQDYQQGHCSYSHVTTCNLDEYCGIDHHHLQSYHYFMQHYLFRWIDILPKNIYIPTCENILEQECKKYNDLLLQNPIDLQILGIGSNGHIGFNEPGTPFDSTVHYVKLDEKTRMDNSRFFKSLEEVPKYAITMGIANIMQAKSIILLAFGFQKAVAIKGLVDGRQTIELPASVLSSHPDATFIVDKQAACLLLHK